MHFFKVKFFSRSLMFGWFVGLMISCPGLLLAQIRLQTPSHSTPSALVLLKKYDSLASVYYKSQEGDKVLLTVQKGEALANQIKNEHYQGIFFCYKALVLKRKYEPDSAFMYSEKALPILRKYKEWKQIARLLFMQSAIYLDKNESVKAAQNLILLISFNEKHNLPLQNGVAYHLLGLTFARLNDTINEKKYLLKYLEFAEQQNSNSQRIYAYTAWGRFLTKQKQYRQAHAYFMKVKGFAEVLNQDEAKIEAWINMGINFAAQKEYVKGLRASRMAEEIAMKYIHEMGWYTTLAKNYNLTSSLYLSMKKPKEALVYAFRAFDLVKGKTDAHEYLVPALKNRIAAQKMLGQYHNALNSYEQLQEITHNIDVNKDRETVKNIEAKYQLDKIQKEKELFQKNLEIKELALQNEQKQSRLLGVLLIFLTLMVAAGFWLFRKNQLYNQKISRKNKELELLNETKDKLFGIIGHDLRAPVVDLNNALTLMEGENVTQQQFLSLTGLLRKKTTSLQTILNNLLYWALSQRHTLHTNPQSIPLKNKIEDVLESLQGLIQEKSLQIEGLTPIADLIEADENHTQIVLYNIIHNAIKFSPINETIHFQITSQAPLVELKITNSGKRFEWDGSPEALSALPSQFGTLNEKGTGLGLLVCAELMKLNRGTIRAYPAAPTGTTLALHFPKSAAVA